MSHTVAPPADEITEPRPEVPEPTVADLQSRIDTLVAERDRAREECGHEKHMRKFVGEERDRFIKLWMALKAEHEPCKEKATTSRDFPYRIALRDDDYDALDDVVVCDVSMFRAEFMDNKTLWMCCYFPDSDQRITFSVRSRRGPLELDVTEQPSESESFTYEPASPSSTTESGAGD